MKLKLLFLLFLPLMGMAQTQIGQDIMGDMPDDQFGHGVALSADGSVMAVSAPGNDNNGIDAGHIRVYSKSSGTWTQIGQDIEGANPDDQIGYKIALSDDGTILAFSATYAPYTIDNETHRGYISIYKNVNNTWTKIGQDIKSNPNIFDTKWLMGLSISLSSDGSTVAISSPYILHFVDAIEIYKNLSGTWTLIGNFGAYITDTNPILSSSKDFGFNVSLSSDGNTVAFSSLESLTSNTYGSVNIFKYTLGNWTNIGQLHSTNDDWYGFRVVLSADGKTLAISAPFSSSNGTHTGRVMVYENNGNNWTQIGSDIFGEIDSDFCGEGLAMSANGKALAIGCIGCDTPNGTDTGKVRVFENIQNNWVEKGNVIGANAGDKIGWSIALSKDGYNLVVGNPGSSSVGGKPYTNNLEEQTVSDNFLQANNYQAKGTFPGSVQVFNLSGILSSDTFVLENFKIYPNPTTGILNIELENSLFLEKVLVYNTIGQLIKESKEKNINLDGLAKGIYHVQVMTDKGKATQKVVVK